MAEVKGRLDVINLYGKNLYQNNELVVTSVNGLTSLNGKINLNKFGDLKVKDDYNKITSTEMYYVNTSTDNNPIEKGNLFNIYSVVQQNKLLFGDEIEYYSSSNNKTSILATKEYVDEKMVDVDLSDYLTIESAKTTYLPIKSKLDATVGKLTIEVDHDYPGLVFKSKNNSCGIEGSRGKGFFFWVDNENGDRTTSIKMPTGTGIVATQEWTNTMIQGGQTHTQLMSPTKQRGLYIDNNGEIGGNLGSYDGWKFDANARLFCGAIQIKSKGVYTGLDLVKSDDNYVRIETNPDGVATMLTFAYRKSGNAVDNLYVIRMPYETGTLATQEWVDDNYTKTIPNVITVKNGETAVREPSLQKGYFYNNDRNMGMYSPESGHIIAIGHALGNIELNKDVSISGTMQLKYPEGTHRYIAYVNGTSRAGFVGYPSNGSTTFQITNEMANKTGNVEISGGKLIVNSPGLFYGNIVALGNLQAKDADSSNSTGIYRRNDQKEGFLSQYVDGAWKGELKIPLSSGTLATQEWVNARSTTRMKQIQCKKIVSNANMVDADIVNLPFDCRGVPMYFQDTSGDMMNMVIFPSDDFQVLSNSGSEGSATIELTNGGTKLRVVSCKNNTKVNNIWVAV